MRVDVAGDDRYGVADCLENRQGQTLDNGRLYEQPRVLVKSTQPVTVDITGERNPGVLSGQSPDFLGVWVSKGRVADEYQLDVALETAERVKQDVWRLLGHQTADEEDIALGLQPEVSQRIRGYRLGFGRTIGNIAHGLTELMLIVITQRPRDYDGLVRNSGTHPVRHAEDGLRPAAPLAAVLIQSVHGEDNAAAGGVPRQRCDQTRP